MTDQIKPPSAVSIWWTPDGWRCELPGPNGTSHTVLVSADKVGSLLAMLRVRTVESKIAEPGDKTQYQLDKTKLKAQAEAILAKHKAKLKAKPKISETSRANIRDLIRRFQFS